MICDIFHGFFPFFYDFRQYKKQFNINILFASFKCSQCLLLLFSSSFRISIVKEECCGGVCELCHKFLIFFGILEPKTPITPGLFLIDRDNFYVDLFLSLRDRMVIKVSKVSQVQKLKLVQK